MAWTEALAKEAYAYKKEHGLKETVKKYKCAPSTLYAQFNAYKLDAKKVKAKKAPKYLDIMPAPKASTEYISVLVPLEKLSQVLGALK